jgi:hypothetical protein
MNKLETLLHRASIDPEARPEFMTVFLQSDLYILGQSLNDAESTTAPNKLAAGSHLEIQNWSDRVGDTFIPIFSSLEVLQSSVTEDTKYVKLSAADLLEITRGSRLILNPASAPAKEFLPGEIDQLLGTGAGYAPESRTLGKETSIEVGQPSEYPLDLCDDLSKLFARYNAVRSAHLALMRTPGEHPEFSYVIALDTGKGNNIGELGPKIGAIAADCATCNHPVDLVTFAPESRELAEIVAQSAPPFYTRQKRSLFQAIFRPGRA